MARPEGSPCTTSTVFDRDPGPLMVNVECTIRLESRVFYWIVVVRDQTELVFLAI